MRVTSVRREGDGSSSGTHPYILAAGLQMLQLLFVSLVCSSAQLLWCICTQLDESEHVGEFAGCTQDQRLWLACFSPSEQDSSSSFPQSSLYKLWRSYLVFRAELFRVGPYPDGSNVASLTASPRDMEARLLGILLHKLTHRICHSDHRKGWPQRVRFLQELDLTASH